MLSACFGFDRFLYIYDHLDLIDRRVDQDGSILNAIWDHISSHLAIVSSKASLAPDRFQGDRFEPVMTERFIVPPEKARTIQFQNPTFPLVVDSCRGCPQFVARFMRIVALLEATESQVAEADRRRGTRSVARDAEQRLARAEALELCRDLVTLDVHGLDDHVLQQIAASPRCTLSLKRKGRK
jgi:hypothetical protein